MYNSLGEVLKRILVTLAVLLLCSVASAKTRWSSIHLIPDADLFESGEFTMGVDGLISQDTAGNTGFSPSIPFKFGITEWINLEVGYARGVNMGLKVRIWGETGRVFPSMAFGVNNIFTNRDAGLFDVDSSTVFDLLIDTTVTPNDTEWVNRYPAELFLAFGKTIDPIKTRFHFGLQSMPWNPSEVINPFAAIEKYFGRGFYASLVLNRRHEEFKLSLLLTLRFLKQHFELTAGAIDIGNMFFDDKGDFALSLAPPEDVTFIHPGVFAGLKFHGRFGRGKKSGLMSFEDRVTKQDETLMKMALAVDSLESQMNRKVVEFDKLQSRFDEFVDSVTYDPTKLSNIIFSKLVQLKTYYDAEPFDAEKVKLLIAEIKGYREKAIAPLQKFLYDPETERMIRVYSAFMLGEIGAKSAVDVLLDVLTTAADTDIKVEILIALGKMKETRAMFLMEQFANSPDDAVAITAQEVLQQLSRETGVSIRKSAVFRSDFDETVDSLPMVVPEKKESGLKPAESGAFLDSLENAEENPLPVEKESLPGDPAPVGVEAPVSEEVTPENPDIPPVAADVKNAPDEGAADNTRKGRSKKDDSADSKPTKDEKAAEKEAKRAERKAQDAKGW